MRNLFPVLLWLLLGLSRSSAATAIVIHGGAGNISPASFMTFDEGQYRARLRQALQVGHQILAAGGSSIAAVEAAIVVMEDSPLFNAGKGAVFTSAGGTELDASIMEGRTRKAGAVGGVTVVKNPIRAARAVMDRTPHVLLVGEGADAFARSSGLEIVDRAYFRTEHRHRDWLKRRNEKPAVKPRKKAAMADDRFFSTVGAVVLDQHGDIAAGTSTGGLTNKRFGRIGDSPIIGAGTYADNRAGGISCTGHGEFFIRFAVAYDILARTRYLHTTMQDSADEVVRRQLKAADAGGGVIGLDPQGNVIVSFNTPGMFRGWVDTNGAMTVKITAD